MTPTAAAGPIPSSPRISASGRERSRGWLGRLRSWNRWRRIGTGAAPASAPALVADEDRRLAASASDDEDRLLEPRVEAGQVRQVRAVLAVGVDDQPVDVVLRAPALAEAFEPRRRRSPPAAPAPRRASRSRAGRSPRAGPSSRRRSMASTSPVAAIDVDELVGVDRDPRPLFAVRPGDADLGPIRAHPARSGSTRAGRRRGRHRPSPRARSSCRRP